jgi:type IV pilus assembly protein PilN
MSAATVRINLLPHREQKRAARQRQFISLAVSLAILAMAFVGLGHMYFASRIDNQNSRNSLLKTEIAKLDEQIKEIDKLREQTQALLARKQVVETLQTNRTEAVHLLDQLVRQLPDGIYLRSVRQQGARVTLVGYAQSNARVSTLMRAIESSPWLSQPELVEIKSVPLPGTQAREGGPRISEFTLNLQVKRLAPPDEKPAPGAAAASAAPVKPASPAPAAAAPSAAPPAAAPAVAKGGKA